MSRKTNIISEAPARQTWFFMLIIALAQIQMGFNVNALTISMGGIVEEFETSPTLVGTGLVVYSLAVAGLVMLGAKLGKRVGSRLTFQIGVIGHGISMAIMAFSSDPSQMILAQLIAGVAAALLVPALVVMISAHYEGKQQSEALGYLQSSQAIAGVLAFLIAGFLATAFRWRYSFGLIAALSVLVLLLSFRLRRVTAQASVGIDIVGAILAAVSILLISIGFDNLTRWGTLVATSNAPFDVLGMSPAPLMIIIGIVLGQAFFLWLYRRQKQGKQPLLSLKVLSTNSQRAATFCLLIIGGLGPAVNFLIPLYMQIVQGRTSLQTSVAIIPYSLAIFAAAFFSVRLFYVIHARRLAQLGFVVVAAGLAWLAVVVQNDLGTPLVIVGLIVVGLGEGMLLTLMFNIMVKSVPADLSGDVGALRGTVNNLSTAVGTALAGAMAIGLLSLVVSQALVEHPILLDDLVEQVNFDNVDFVSNDTLVEMLAENTTATAEEKQAAVELNEESRLHALQIAFLALAALAVLAIIPASGLNARRMGEAPQPVSASSTPPDDEPKPSS